ncbi:unnamed protein product, partial [Symbiodinium pilosum]
MNAILHVSSGEEMKRYPLCSIREYLCIAGNKTLQPIYKCERRPGSSSPPQVQPEAMAMIAVVFVAFPSCRPAVVVEHRGDWKWAKEVWGMLHDRSSDAGDYASLSLKAWSTRLFIVYLDNCAHDKLASDASCREDKELLMGSLASRTMVLWLHELEVADRRYLTQAQAASAAAHGLCLSVEETCSGHAIHSDGGAIAHEDASAQAEDSKLILEADAEPITPTEYEGSQVFEGPSLCMDPYEPALKLKEREELKYEARESFVERVSHEYEQNRSNKFEVQSGFYTDQMMIDELKFSRKDKYEKKLLWYWVDTKYTGTRTEEDKDFDDDGDDDENDESGSEDADKNRDDMDGVPQVLDEILKQQKKSKQVYQRCLEVGAGEWTVLTAKAGTKKGAKGRGAADNAPEEAAPKRAAAKSKGHSASGTRAAMELVPTIMAALEVTDIDIGLDCKHPVIFPSSYVKSLADNGKLCRGFKKGQIMVLGSEPVLGYGCEAEDEITTSEPVKMNFRGNTYKTRQLFTVVPKKLYSKDATCLNELINQWSDDWSTCFSGLRIQHEGSTIELRLAVVGLKGVTLLDFNLSGSHATGAVKCLEHIYAEMKSFAAERDLYLHMTGLTRTLLSWSSSADFPTGSWFKGADTVVVLRYLAWKFQQVLTSDMNV